jgi:hypothetical protein
MKDSLTNTTIELIDRLYQKPSLWERLTLTDTNEQLILLVQLIKAQNEPLAARDLLPIVFAANNRLAQEAARAIHHLVGQISPQDLTRFSDSTRSEWYRTGPWRSSWFEIKPDDLSKLAEFRTESVSLLGLASLHNSGYVRERAVELLASRESGAELRFLLLRLNDWVSNVRDRAHEAVSARLIPENAPLFAQNLSLVIGLQRTSRARHEEVINGVKRILAAPQNRVVLHDIIGASDRAERRFGYQLLLKHTDGGTSEVILSAMEDRDAVIRQWALQECSQLLETSHIGAILALGLRDSVARVRSLALSLAHRQLPELAVEFARTALVDTSGTVREQARFILKATTPDGFADRYRQILSGAPSSRVMIGAILGLGETGTAGDSGILRTFLAYSQPRIRRAALGALNKLAGSDSIDVFLRAVHDPSPQVSLQARRGLMHHISRIQPKDLERALHEAREPHSKRNALHLFIGLRKWDSLALLLRASDDTTLEISNLAKVYLRQWLKQFNRGFSQPSSEERALLRNDIESRRLQLGRDLHRELEFHTRA